MSRRFLTKNEIEEMILMFTRDLMTLRQIGEKFKVSAMGVQKALKRYGTDTSKMALNFTMKCAYCGVEFKKLRSAIKKSMKNFCSKTCYQNHVKLIHEGSTIDRSGQQVSRKKMEKFYGNLPEKSIVHHIDGNDRNVFITNLMLLVSQADHIMIHKNYGNPQILFDGSKLRDKYPGFTDLGIEEVLNIPFSNLRK